MNSSIFLFFLLQTFFLMTLTLTCLNNGTYTAVQPERCVCILGFVGTRCELRAIKLKQQMVYAQLASKAPTYFHFQPIEPGIFRLRLRLCIDITLSPEETMNLLSFTIEGSSASIEMDTTIEVAKLSWSGNECVEYISQYIKATQYSNGEFRKIIAAIQPQALKHYLTTEDQQMKDINKDGIRRSITISGKGEIYSLQFRLNLILASTLTLLLIMLYMGLNRTVIRQEKEEAKIIIEAVKETFEQFKSRGQAIKSEENCSICLDSFRNKDAIAVTVCLHLYHQECLKDWEQKSSRCPICRAIFSNRARAVERLRI